MKKSDKHINWLNFGIFYGTCLFVCGFTYEEVLTRLKRTKAGDWILAFESTKDVWDRGNSFAAKRTLVTGQTFFFLVIRERFDFTDYSHRKLAHECLHLASFHLKDFLDPMLENESFCYLHTHLMEQCHNILRK